jgi:hypothetical protein
MAKDYYQVNCMVKKNEITKFYLRTEGELLETIGSSGEPILKDGWKIKLEPSDKDKVGIGDIVVFGKSILTCHRIIGKLKMGRSTYFIHRGDNSRWGGVFFSQELIGKVVTAYNKDGQETNSLENRNIRPLPKPMQYLYLIMYLTKRRIFGNNTNALSRFIDRLFWSLLSKRA